ncbi:MAG TPA: DNA-binding response regulator [Anaerolineales bacterium]|nr:DNA-binding response regulator [Anaerolineales bacterium]HND49162.1 DNA-binding response regulator [Anaerolineales bacterium]
MNMRALIVDDDTSWQGILSEMLIDNGFEVDTANTVDEAVAALKDNSHRLAVVDLSLSVSDHHNQDGLRVLDAVRLLDPNCRAILLTGFATVEVAVKALTEYNAFTFLRKESFKRSEFKDVIQRILVSAPTVDEPHASSADLKLDSASQTSAPLKALIVDDDAGWRSILEDLLSEAEFQPVPCASFGEALGLIRKDKFSLAIVDLSLRDTQSLDGLQLLKITQGHHIPTIVVSGLSEPEEIQRIYAEHSISTYIEKQAFDRNAFKRILAETRELSTTMDELSILTDREREVLDLLAQGLTNKEIAEKLVITTNTVKRHLKAVFEKLDVHTRAAAVAIATKSK